MIYQKSYINQIIILIYPETLIWTSKIIKNFINNVRIYRATEMGFFSTQKKCAKISRKKSALKIWTFFENYLSQKVLQITNIYFIKNILDFLFCPKKKHKFFTGDKDRI